MEYQEEFVRVILNMHEGTSCKVMVDSCLSDPSEVKSGVMQGGILLPLLFVLLMDYIMKKVKVETEAGILSGENGKLLDLDYDDDDIVLVCNGPEEVQGMLDCLVNEGRKAGLVINNGKTEIMNMNIENAQDCITEAMIIKQVNMFTYLGTYLVKDGSLNLEFKERIKKAHQAMGVLKNIWNNNNLSVHTKIQIYKVMVRSTVYSDLRRGTEKKSMSHSL